MRRSCPTESTLTSSPSSAPSARSTGVGNRSTRHIRELVDSRTFTIGDGDAMFHFEIQGDTITFEPVLPEHVLGLRLCMDARGRLPRLHLAAREVMTAVSLVAIVLVLAVCGGSPTEIDDDPPLPQTSVDVSSSPPALDGTWVTDTIAAAEIRAVVLDAGFTREDAATVIAGFRHFRFELHFEEGQYELRGFWDERGCRGDRGRRLSAHGGRSALARHR